MCSPPRYSKFGHLWAVQNTRYKMIWNTTKDQTQLFDLKKDPGEKRDISEQSQMLLRHF